MSTDAHLSFDTLVAYWAGDLSELETDSADEHLLSCAHCTERSAGLASVVQALREAVPPVVDRATIEKLRARGARIRESTFQPNQRTPAVFPADADFLIHRLRGLDLSDAEHVDVTIRVESSGEVLVEAPRVPFDAADGVLIACQQHFRHLPPDTLFEVRAVSSDGRERVAVYDIPHVFSTSPA